MFLSYIYILFYLAFIGIIDIDDAIQELVETVRIKFHCRFFGKDEDDIQLEDIICAASLAHHRVLDYDTVEYLSLNDVNLSKVPTEHLASLVSHVTKDFNINNISGCDLVTILERVQCQMERGDPGPATGHGVPRGRSGDRMLCEAEEWT